MKIYVATSYDQKHIASRWMRRLEDCGHFITFDWTIAESPERGELSLSESEQRKIALLDSNGVRDAEIVWVLAPMKGGCGCWFEMGLGVALGKEVIVSGDRRTIFTALPEVRYFETNQHAFKDITSRPSLAVIR
jgi:hypothetical protein